MLLTNHALTGALVGLALPDKALVPPVAFAAHLAMDTLPHTGGEFWGMGKGSGLFQSRRAQLVGIADCAVALSSWLALIHFFPHQFWALTLGTFFCCLPDLLFIPEIYLGIVVIKPFRNFHSGIQKFERPWGFGVDLVWAGLVSWLISRIG